MPDLTTGRRRFRATAAGLDFYVEIAVLGRSRRYAAFASIAGNVELGFGASPRAAIQDVLAREFGAVGWQLDERPRPHPSRL